MAKIAIMGFGTVGSGVLEVLRLNGGLNERLTGEKIEVKYILDIRDFSDQIQQDGRQQVLPSVSSSLWYTICAV